MRENEVQKENGAVDVIEKQNVTHKATVKLKNTISMAINKNYIF